MGDPRGEDWAHKANFILVDLSTGQARDLLVLVSNYGFCVFPCFPYFIAWVDWSVMVGELVLLSVVRFSPLVSIKTVCGSCIGQSYMRFFPLTSWMQPWLMFNWVLPGSLHPSAWCTMLGAGGDSVEQLVTWIHLEGENR